MFSILDTVPAGMSTLLDSTVGPVINTQRTVFKLGAPILLGRTEALEVARLARQLGWLDDETVNLRRVLAEREEELAQARAKLSMVRDFAHIEAA